jgi:chromosome segregation ATPase
MTREAIDLVASFRGGLLEEAAQARQLASRIRSLDFQEPKGPHGIREVERALDEYSTQVLGIGEALERLDAVDAKLPALLQGWERARAARHSSWTAITRAVEGLGASLQGAQSERALDRLRLLEGLRLLSRESAEAARLSTRVAELDREVQGRQAEIHARDERIQVQRTESDQLAVRVSRYESELASAKQEIRARDLAISERQAEVARLDAILAQDGHRLIIRVGSMLARYPRIRSVLQAPLRLLLRLMNRSPP